ncbi:MAG: class I SAM-dependent methyltransferase [Planctomycetaceae bacterium]|nr:class I SAM-dependent methyltransferase [Planctomycetaceae bacterium]
MPSDPTFTTPDYAGPFRRNAEQLLMPLAGRPLRYLEIGVLEGRSAIWMLEHVLTHPQSRYVGIDCYVQSKQRAGQLFATARTNLRRYGRKAELHNARSVDVLPRLARQRELFDVIYIDGDHTAFGVGLDTMLSWPLLRDGGLLAFDDMRHPKYKSLRRMVHALRREVPHEVLLSNEQLWLRKLADS